MTGYGYGMLRREAWPTTDLAETTLMLLRLEPVKAPSESYLQCAKLAGGVT